MSTLIIITSAFAVPIKLNQWNWTYKLPVWLKYFTIKTTMTPRVMCLLKHVLF